MSEDVLESKPRPKKKGRSLDLPLTRREIMTIVLLSLVVGGIYYGRLRVFDEQIRILTRLTQEASGLAEMSEYQRIRDDIERAKELEEQNEAWVGMVERIRGYFPENEGEAISYIDLLGILGIEGEIEVTGSRPSGSVELSFYPAEPEEEEEGEYDDEEKEETPLEDIPPEGLVVYYKENNYRIEGKITFKGWLTLIRRLEKLNKFYRFKNVNLRMAPVGGESSGSEMGSGMGASDRSKKKEKNAGPSKVWLDFDVEMASYSIAEFGYEEPEEE